MSISLVSAEEYFGCFGSECHEINNKVYPEIEEFIIDAVLHNDDSVSYSQTIGLKYKETTLFSADNTTNYSFFLPQSKIDATDIKVKELLSGVEFKKVYFLENDCHGQFIFYRDKNIIKLCTKIQKQYKFNVKTTILSNKNYSTYLNCNNTTHSVSNDLII